MVNQSRTFRLHPAQHSSVAATGRGIGHEVIGNGFRDLPAGMPSALDEGHKNRRERFFTSANRLEGLPPWSAATKNPASAGSLIHSSPEWWAVQGSNL